MSFDNGEVKIGIYAIFITYCDWLIKKQNGSFFVNHWTQWLFNKHALLSFLRIKRCFFILYHWQRGSWSSEAWKTVSDALSLIVKFLYNLQTTRYILQTSYIEKLNFYISELICLYFKLFFLRIKKFFVRFAFNRYRYTNEF